MSISVLEEKPPLRLQVGVESASLGNRARWASDESDPRDAISDLSFSDTMPGGDEQASGTLIREFAREFPDQDDLEKITIRGLGEVAWQGRLDQSPKQSGDNPSNSPQGVGFQAHLDDKSSVRMIPIDIDMSAWQAASVQRKINLVYTDLIDTEDGQTVPDQTTGNTSLETGFQGSWARSHEAESWYDAGGVPLAAIYWAWKLNGIVTNLGAVDPNWSWYAGLSDDDVASSFDVSSDQKTLIFPGWSGIGSGSLAASTGGRKWAFVFLLYAGAGGADGHNYAIDWMNPLAVIGNHGIPLRGAYPNLGVYASDVLAYGLATWCPKLSFSVNPNPGYDPKYSIQQSTYSIPHLPFKTATTMSEVVKQSTRFELADWYARADAAGNPTFYLNQRGDRARRWRARSGPSKLNNAGKSSTNLWNGAVIAYNDVTGVTRTVGPIGSGADSETALAHDPDPENPATQAGYDRWAPLTMNTGTADSATKVVQSFLQEQKLLDTSGEAEFDGYIQDAVTGLWWPAWMARSGDEVSFVDASDPSYRRIVRRGFADASKAASVSLDAPPDGMQQLLERLSLSLLPTGGS